MLIRQKRGIPRVGDSFEVDLGRGASRRLYVFERDAAGDFVCEVDDAEHVARFISIAEGYEIHPRALKEADPVLAAKARAIEMRHNEELEEKAKREARAAEEFERIKAERMSAKATEAKKAAAAQRSDAEREAAEDAAAEARRAEAAVLADGMEAFDEPAGEAPPKFDIPHAESEAAPTARAIEAPADKPRVAGGRKHKAA